MKQDEGFAAGARAALPVVLGYLSIGFAAGVVQRAAGLSVAEVVLMSTVLYAGSAQFAAAGMIAAAAQPGAVIATVFFVNLRHLLLSAALAPFFARLPAWKNALLGAQLTDETFVVAWTRLQGARNVSPAWMAGLNVSAYLSWALATAAGALAGDLVADTRSLGFDFALPAMFAALLVLQLASHSSQARALSVAVLSAGIAVGTALALPGHWGIIAATLLGATLGLILERWKSAPKSC
ncbi:MAG: AzlC family ABC transporter permease [Betaproteobacteria bacterium]|nr:AzlC family ABC transporter permease [Betaproteobacteria bacterium]